MIDFTEIPHDSDAWELFCRDYLVARGFAVESPPDRGADGGKDMLVTEQLPGRLNNYSFRWLVSCKHFAKSKRSVNEQEEQNILERVKAFRADGFLGIYSTLASAALNTRLAALRRDGLLKDYSIIDHRLLENELITIGFSHIMMRYFPQSYAVVKPLHLVVEDYLPLRCRECDKDLLLHLFESQRKSIIVFVKSPGRLHNSYEDIYCVCKGSCDRRRVATIQKDCITSWKDISDLAIPVEFLMWQLSFLNLMHEGQIKFTDSAFNDLKQIMIALAQKVLRHTTENEFSRIKLLREMPF